MAISQPGYGWTEDRVDTLKKLWGDGFSASQIATRMGGVSRNSVIGKVHRLGLSGRRTTDRKPRERKLYTLPLRPTLTQKRSIKSAVVARNATHQPQRQSDVVSAVLSAMQERQDLPEALRLDIICLDDGMCRWPSKHDPKDPEFHFCGLPKVRGSSYCAHHAQRGWAPRKA